MDDDVSLLEIVAVPGPGCTVIRIIGDLDASTRDRAWEVLGPAAAAAASGDLVVEAGGLGFLDSSGIGVLVRCAKALEGGRLVIRDPSPQITRVLQIAGLVGFFSVEGA